MATRRSIGLRALLISGLVVAALWSWVDSRMRVRLVAREGSPEATALRLRDLDGAPVSLAEYRGRVVLLNLWASWCRPCRVEIPRLGRLHGELQDRGLAVLGLNVEQLPTPALLPIVRELAIPYPVLVPDEGLDGTFSTDGSIPQTWLIDRQGHVRASHTGLATERSLRRACLKLLAEPTAR